MGLRIGTLAIISRRALLLLSCSAAQSRNTIIMVNHAAEALEADEALRRRLQVARTPAEIALKNPEIPPIGAVTAQSLWANRDPV